MAPASATASTSAPPPLRGLKRLFSSKKSKPATGFFPLLPDEAVSSSSSSSARRAQLNKPQQPKDPPATGDGANTRKVLVQVVDQDAAAFTSKPRVQQEQVVTVTMTNNTGISQTHHGETRTDQAGDPSFETTAPSSRSLQKYSIHHNNRHTDNNDDLLAILSRPFGRASLIQHSKQQQWVVEVSPAEWDSDEYKWKYRILVQRRALLQHSASDTPSSFTTAFTWRSLEDFEWLERALRAEFHGSLLLPLLSMYVGMSHAQHEVDATSLRDWLFDVLNGTRGQGEVVLPTLKRNIVCGPTEDTVLACEAMEAFLYLNTKPVVNEKNNDTITAEATTTKSALSVLDDPWRTSAATVTTTASTDSHDENREEESFVQSLWTKPLSCWPAAMDSWCSGGVDAMPPSTNSTPQRPTTTTTTTTASRGRLPIEMMNCSSRALEGAASLQVQDSFAASEQLEYNGSMLHSQLLEAERELVNAYRRTAMRAMDKLRVLTELETEMGVAWKQFAACLSGLYTYEKELGGIRLDSTKGKKETKISHRKLGKKSVEELLMTIAQKKTERSTVALRLLDAMLAAYIGDLTAVGPALKAYSDAVIRLTHLEQSLANQNTAFSQNGKQKTSKSWQGKLKNMASHTVVEVKKQVSTGDSANTETTATTVSSDADNAVAQKRAFEERVIENERRLRESLTCLCRNTLTRTARMAYHFCSTEASQASQLNTAAHSLRTKMNIVDREKMANMIARHKRESAEDDVTEMDLVYRIVNIGTEKKFGDSENARGDVSRGLCRDEALQLVRSQLGQWESKLALAIMKAVGAGDDAEVRVEETTRDLRLVRKYAIGLREHLGRCEDAIDSLRSRMVYGDSDVESKREIGVSGDLKHLRECRQGFVSDISDVCSGKLLDEDSMHKPKSASTSISILSSAGIVMNDPAGWTAPSKGKRSHGTCRGKLASYIDLKHTRTQDLLRKLNKRLKDYEERIEGIESYVYMECVGIQLEKFYSSQRTEALAAFEQKTDINTAINIATRKRLPLLVKELEAKLEKVPNVSHTSVKELKEMHLMSKSLKSELSMLATRRFLRAREAATELVIELMTEWAQFEEETAKLETLALGETIAEVERTFLQLNVAAGR